MIKNYNIESNQEIDSLDTKQLNQIDKYKFYHNLALQ